MHFTEITDLYTLEELLLGQKPTGYVLLFNPATQVYGTFDENAELPEGWVVVNPHPPYCLTRNGVAGDAVLLDLTPQNEFSYDRLFAPVEE